MVRREDGPKTRFFAAGEPGSMFGIEVSVETKQILAKTIPGALSIPPHHAGPWIAGGGAVALRTGGSNHDF